jgi:hypothetical protein
LVVKARIGLRELRLGDGVGPITRFWGWGAPGVGTRLPPHLLFLELARPRLLSDQYHAHGFCCHHDVEQQRLSRFWSYHD